jgi:hypothetical protein
MCDAVGQRIVGVSERELVYVPMASSDSQKCRSKGSRLTAEALPSITSAVADPIADRERNVISSLEYTRSRKRKFVL